MKIPKEGKNMKLDKEKTKKGIALLMGIVMIVTIFAAMPTAKAWNIVSVTTDNSRGDNMVEINGYTANVDPFYPGEQDRIVRVTIHNLHDGPNVAVNRVMVSVQSVRGPDGAITTNAVHWDVDTDNGPGGTGYTINPDASQTTQNFQFDIDPDMANAPPGTYNITFKVDYEYDDDANGATPDVADSELEYMEFEIAANIDVSDAYPDLYAGQTFTPLSIDVDDDWNGVHNLYLNLSAIPQGIHFDQTSGWIPGDVETDTIGFRVDVDSDMAPGIYTVDYQVQYFNNDDVWCTETGTLDITVAYTPAITAQLTGDEITVTQGDESIPAMGITFTNNGNVDLRNIVVDLAYDGTFFFAPANYYEGNEGSDEQNPVQMTEVEIDSLNVGQTNDEGTWYVALNPYVQAGEHKILFTWTATYFDDGATLNPTHYVDVQMQWWDDDGNDATPLVPEIRFNHGFGWGLWISDWIAGPYVMVNVVDDHPDLTAEKLVNEDSGNNYIDVSDDNLLDVEVSSVIHNFELVQFTDLKATLQVGPGTPFWNPMDHGVTTVENDLADSDDTVNAGGDAEMWWHVDINPNTAPGMYTIYITLSGRNADTTEYMNTTIPVAVQVRGMGPVLMVTSVVNGDVEPGKIFYMNLTITNQGDDTARNVFVMVPGSFGYNWDVIDGFVDSISSYNFTDYGQDYTRNVSSNGITLEQLNINDAKDIVDLSLYIEGVFNPPSPEIWFIMADNVAPGESINVVFKMMTNVNMVKGRPYEVDVMMGYSDSYGDNWMTFEPITIRTTDPGTPYHGETDAFAEITSNNVGLLMLFILFLIFIVLVIGLSMMKGDKKDKKPEEPAPVMDENFVEPVESEEMPPAAPIEGEEIGEDLDVSGEVEPGFTESEEVEPDFALEEKDEGESSF